MSSADINIFSLEISKFWYIKKYRYKLHFDIFKNIFWEYSFIMNKHNQKPTDMFNKQDLTVYLTYIKILKDLNILNFRLHISEAIFKLLNILFIKHACWLLVMFIHFDTYFLIILTLFKTLKIALMNLVTILMMPAKITTLALFKIKLFWNIGCDVIILSMTWPMISYHVTQIIL